MRIPLDYYRILGVPIQANDEQLSQAYQDRSLQLPRREYSDRAIAERKKLLEEAYKVLSDPEQRAEYNVRFLEKTSEAKSLDRVKQTPGKTSKLTGIEADYYSPSIEIGSEQFVGALLILLELGEYELAIGLGKDYLNNPPNNGREQENLGQIQKERILKSDTVLTLALAYLELSREQWQQGEYENAASSGQMSLELLVQEKLFASTQEEIQTDLNKLRPYRILELLSQNEENSERRNKGLQLLKEMLQERGGIDGTGEDRSGLSIDECLRFVQQLRSYLTAEEQQELFETEAKRPSAVATYLAVYALLARGFAQKQPALIFQAKEMLRRLSRCQDVHLEQAVCALLLGQTEEASLALERSQESEPLAFIREHSQGSPDLLPGLCLYGERWLQTEVFSHFRDLANQQTSLKQYFANEEVQAYLEQLPEETPLENKQVENEKEQEIATEAAQTRARINNSFQKRKTEGIKEPAKTFNASNGGSRPKFLQQQKSGKPTAERAVLTVSAAVSSASGVSNRASDSSRKLLNSSTTKSSETNSSVQSTSKQNNRKQRLKALREQIAKSSVSLEEKEVNIPHQPRPTRRGTEANKNRKRSPKINNLLKLSIPVLMGLAALGFVSQRLEIGRIGEQNQEEQQLVVQLDRPLIDIPSPTNAQPPQAQKKEIMSKETAAKVVESWLKSKSEAFGANHQIEGLNNILTGSLLSKWRTMALDFKQSNAYREYQHAVEIRSVKTNEQKPLQATIEAAIGEIAKHYQGGKIEQANSYNDKLVVRYELVRQQEQWLIKEIHVVD